MTEALNAALDFITGITVLIVDTPFLLFAVAVAILCSCIGIVISLINYR